MKRTLSVALFTLGISVAAQASITSWSQYSSAGLNYYDNGGYLFSANPGNFGDMSFSAFPGGMTNVNDTMKGHVLWSNTLTSASASYLQMDARFSGYAFAVNNNPWDPQVWAYGTGQLTFTLDSAGTATIKAFGTATYTAGSNAFNYNTLYLDGYLLTTAVDGTFNVALGAGSHVAFYQGWTQVYPSAFSSGQAGLDAQYQVTVTSVPEPGTMAALGAGALALVRGRRNRKSA